MIKIDEKDIIEKLCNVKDPVTNKSVSESKSVSNIKIKNNFVEFTLDTSPEINKMVLDAFKDEAEKHVMQIENIKSVNAIIDFSKFEEQKKQSYGTNKVSHIIAVSSGKGGVGKSTVSTNLAVMFHKLGLKVGILDSDIYGPSVAKMMGLEKQEIVTQNKKIIPPEIDGIKIMSMGLLLDDDQPVIFRGPMLLSAVKQFLIDVDWGELDLLIIDMPPGTGDVAMTVSKTVDIDGAIVVSTPQDIALIDVKKSIAMFQKLNVDIIGIIQNMAYFECPHCQKQNYIFSKNGAKKLADKISVTHLGDIPLYEQIMIASDKGKPFVKDIDKNSEDFKIYSMYGNIINNIIDYLNN